MSSRGELLVQAVNEAERAWRDEPKWADNALHALIGAVREYLAVTDVECVDEPIGYMPASWPEVRQLQAEARGDYR